MPSRDILSLRALEGEGGWASWVCPTAAAAVPWPGTPQTRFGIPDPQLLFVTPKRLGVYPKSRDEFSGGKMPAARSHVGNVVFVET